MQTISRLSLLVALALATPLLAAEECPEVDRAGFTSAMQAREPGDLLAQVPSEARTLYFFTDVRGGRGETLIHQWQHGDTDTEVRLRIGADRWRTWSSHRVPSAQGHWQVSVRTGHGCDLGSWSLAGAPAPSQPAAQPPARASTPDTPAPATQRAHTTRAERLDQAAMQALLADNDVIGLRMLLDDAEARGVNRDEISRARRITLVLASARREIEHDRLHTARARLLSLAGQTDMSEEEQASREALLALADARARALSQDYLYWLAAWDITLNRGLAGGALCADPSAFASDWPAHVNDSLAWVDRQDTPGGYRFILLDHRTAQSHTLTLHCPMRHMQYLRGGQVSLTGTGD
ncbi:DUF2914 domain-containing protein [Isoalcanivorax indicus]|uniref:DUF2914 domain-containing protein n=1 Tax=Isoalcanivorax indicus TaxID=2202653 RepID=UPI0013C45336|nr:DUF2914 domain-containing protein [Isoalcanivorax indicus]